MSYEQQKIKSLLDTIERLEKEAKVCDSLYHEEVKHTYELVMKLDCATKALKKISDMFPIGSLDATEREHDILETATKSLKAIKAWQPK